MMLHKKIFEGPENGRRVGGLWLCLEHFGAMETTPVAQQMPNKVLRSNACNAAAGKVLAKCENPLCLRHFGEH
jgi:hypothetical protein